jgi:hypothetical protein
MSVFNANGISLNVHNRALISGSRKKGKMTPPVRGNSDFSARECPGGARRSGPQAVLQTTRHTQKTPGETGVFFILLGLLVHV